MAVKRRDATAGVRLTDSRFEEMLEEAREPTLQTCELPIGATTGSATAPMSLESLETNEARAS